LTRCDIFKESDVNPVPRKEITGIVNLHIRVHVYVYDIIVERTVGGNGWDEGDFGSDSDFQFRIVW